MPRRVPGPELLGMSVRTDPWEPAQIVGWPSVFGWVICIGALVAIFWRGGMRVRMWWGIGLAFFLLAFGTKLHIGGTKIKWLPMPADLLASLPLLSSLRAYHRALILVVLALAVLFAVFLARVEMRDKLAGAVSKRGRILAWLILGHGRRRIVATGVQCPPQ